MGAAGRDKWPADDPYFTKAPWIDATILGPPEKWGGDLPGGAIPKDTLGFDDDGPAADLADAAGEGPLGGAAARACRPGEYTLRCRTIDAKGQAQPMPRPFKKSGRAEIEAVKLDGEGVSGTRSAASPVA